MIASGGHLFISFTQLTGNRELRTQFQEITTKSHVQAGAFMLLVRFLGYCNYYFQMLIDLWNVIIIFLPMEITTRGLAAVYRNEAEKEAQAFLKSSINKYYAVEEKDDVTLMWNYIMTNVKCCRVDSSEDFRESNKWTKGNETLEGDVTKFQPKFKTTHTDHQTAISTGKRAATVFL
jgi:hypothetical protein